MASLVAVAVPSGLVALTATRMVVPTSLELSVKVELLAPAIGWQLSPLESQRCH